MKIKEYYLNKAKYIAIDESGKKFAVKIDYWNNTFNLSDPNETLEKAARDMLKRKHKVNFASKLLK